MFNYLINHFEKRQKQKPTKMFYIQTNKKYLLDFITKVSSHNKVLDLQKMI